MSDRRVRSPRGRLRRLSIATLLVPMLPLAVAGTLVLPHLAGADQLELVIGAGAALVSLAALVALINRLEAARQSLQGLYEDARLAALRDPLTGLGNHRAFQEEFTRQLEVAARYRTQLALIQLDLDSFKTTNDTLGHAAGDALLLEMRRLMLGTLRRADIAFRIGGDEFAILMPHTDPAEAALVGRRLLAAALDVRSWSVLPATFSFSAGVSAYPTPGADQAQLQGQADAALYWAKAHGRTLVEVFDPGRHGARGVKPAIAQLSASVADVVARHALTPAYQPLVDLTDGRILGYEGLVRPWPNGALPDPAALFSAAASAGRQVELDWACLEVIAAGAAGLAAGLLLSVNLSPRSFESPEFSAAALVRLFEANGIEPGRIVLEVTEQEAIEDLASIRRSLTACREAGFRLAADDIGAGNAGLRLLSQVRFDVIKVDLSLVQAGPDRQSALQVLRSLQEFAQGSGAWLVGEGIEQPEQLELVRDLHVRAGQGYLLGPPGRSPDGGIVDLAPLLARDDWLRRLAGGSKARIGRQRLGAAPVEGDPLAASPSVVPLRS